MAKLNNVKIAIEYSNNQMDFYIGLILQKAIINTSTPHLGEGDKV